VRADAGAGLVTRFVLLGALFLFGVASSLGVASSASAGPVTDQLKVGIERVLKTLTDPAFQGPDRAGERRRAVREITDPMFDWTEMAKRALGRHWHTRTEAERQEFVPLFHNLLERTYVTRIERYDGEQIAYLGESIDGDQATVRTKVLDKTNRELPVEYRMLRGPDGRWVIYDVLIEGVSFVANYRSQFDQIIRTASYERLVAKLKSPSS
jgi:phospholipid transport system substrate-binding protein